MKVLMTFGGTREPIDGVRFLTNFSTGQTGSFIADDLHSRGMDVTCLYAQGALTPISTEIKKSQFESTADLNQKLKRILSEESFDAVIHLAAVSDFRVSEIQTLDRQTIPAHHKIPSDQEVWLRLTPNPKILPQLKKYSRHPKTVVVGFKLTSGQSESERKAAIEKISLIPTVDYIVHNDLESIKDQTHPYRIFKKQDSVCEGQTLSRLSRDLFTLLGATQ